MPAPQLSGYFGASLHISLIGHWTWPHSVTNNLLDPASGFHFRSSGNFEHTVISQRRRRRSVETFGVTDEEPGVRMASTAARRKIGTI